MPDTFHIPYHNLQGKIALPIGAYVITSRDHVTIAGEACAGGAKVIQYRDKVSSMKEKLITAQKIHELTRKNGALFIVNDYLDLALIIAADGVHLGQDDLPVDRVRNIAPLGFIIGISTHSLSQALAAERDGADYIGIGPVFPTPTKEGVAAIGLDAVRQVIQAVHIPVVAIGGINIQNLPLLRDIGVQNVAMVRQFQDGTAQAVPSVQHILAEIPKEL